MQPLRGSLIPTKWHRDPTVIIQPYLSMLYIFHHYRQLGVICRRDPFFRKWKWVTLDDNTKHRTLDEAIEHVLAQQEPSILTERAIESRQQRAIGN